MSLRRRSTDRARRLRREMSLPEVMLWQQLRGQKQGFKVRRQHPLGDYVADFFVASAGLVIEVDGQVHNLKERASADARRDQRLSEQGLTVVRIAATDILNEMQAVLDLIVQKVTSPLHHPADGPPPRKRGGM